MKKETKKISIRGSSYITVCIIVIACSMIISLGIYFSKTITTAFDVKENVKLAVDGYIITNSIDIYQNIKRGNDYIEAIDKEAIIDTVVDKMGLSEGENNFVKKGNSGIVLFKISFDDICFIQKNKMEFVLKFKVTVPVEFNDEVLFWLDIPMQTRSLFVTKV